MLIFFKSTRGLHKNAPFFPIFLNIKYSHSLIFSTDWWQSTFSSYLCLGWLTSIVPRWQREWRHLGTSVMDWVSRRQPLTYQTYPQASSAPLTNAALDDINKGRLCFLTQNYTNNQSKIQNNGSSVFFGIKCKKKKKMLAKPNNAKKSTSTIGKSLTNDGRHHRYTSE